jgi:hypothetical protein
MATTNETARSGKKETLREVLERIQRMQVPDYLLMEDHGDWLVVLQCMQDRNLFKNNPQRPPLAAFEQWLRKQNVPQLMAHCSVRNLIYTNKKIKGARYPWAGVVWEPHVIKRWRVLYKTLDKMLAEIQDT